MYFHCLFFRCKQLLDDIFVISRIPVIKVEVGIINQSSRLRISQKLKLIIVSHTEKKRSCICLFSDGNSVQTSHDYPHDYG